MDTLDLHPLTSRSALSLLLTCFVALTGCASSSVTPTPEATANAPQTTEVTSTALLTDTPTPYANETAPTGAEAAATAPLNPFGPWMLFLAPSDRDQNADNLWATNADGTNMNKLLDERVVTFSVQPGHSLKDGVLVAYVTLTDYQSRDLTLKLLHLPDGRTETVTPLIDDKKSQSQIDTGDATYALANGGLAWSADGTQLAFVGQINGSSMDVYRYEVAARTIHWMSSGPYQAFQLEWSPDQHWIIHEAFDYIGMGGGNIEGMWSANVDGGGIATLAQNVPPNGFKGDIKDLGWQDSTHKVLGDYMYGNGDSSLWSVDITTGEATHIVTTRFYSAAYSRSDDAWLLEDYDNKDPQSPLSLFHAGTMTGIPGYKLGMLSWSDLYGAFIGSSDDSRLYTITSSGQVTQLPFGDRLDLWNPPTIIASPDKTLWAWYTIDPLASLRRLWVGQPKAKPTAVAQLMGDDSFRTAIWSPDSQRLFLFTDHGLWAAARPDFKLVQVVDSSYTHYWYDRHPQWVN